jgi:hypothetical protein
LKKCFGCPGASSTGSWTRVGAALAVALLTGAAWSAANQELLAPDGERGLGAETTLQEFHSLLRSKDEADVGFLDGLYGLEGEIGVQVALVREHYRKQGWFALLERRDEQDLAHLHAAYLSARDGAIEALGGKPKPARALAQMLSDTRFNVRLQLLEGFEFEAREVRAGMAVLRATGDGYVVLSDEERRAVLTRIDLAASLLRALRKDLSVLRPMQDDAPEDLARELLEIPKLRPEEERAGALRNALLRADQGVEQMQSALFRTRLAPKLGTLLTWRKRQLELAEPVRVEALTCLFDTSEGKAAPASIAKLAKHERMRAAMSTGHRGLGIDPLNEDLAWAAGSGADFLWDKRESRPYYDRYLALRGIRAHDHRTLKDRKLNEREQQALFVVQSDGPSPFGQ